MFGINKILNKLANNEPLTEEEKVRLLRSKKVDRKVVRYLANILNNLNIEIVDDYSAPMIELMKEGFLAGWCWESTEAAIAFFNDDACIERGNLYVDEITPEYYHSWICFSFDGTQYIFDPSLDFLCKKDDYYKIFDVDVKGKVNAKEIREELLKLITTSNEEEVIVDGTNDVNDLFYRSESGYIAKVVNGKIKKMTVHYYYGDY